MDFRNRQTWRWMAVLGLVVSVALVASACAAPVAPAQPTPVPIPQMTVDVSDTSLTAPAEMPSGIVEVIVKNSGEAPHGPLLARLNEGATLDQFMQAFQEDQTGATALALVTLLGGGQAAPGASQSVVYDLKPGNHIVLDFGAGPPQTASFVVKAEGASTAAPPAADVNADLVDFNFVLPDQIKAGAHSWKIENKGAQWHEMAIVKLNEGVAVEDVLAMMSQEQPSEGPPPYEQVAFWTPMGAGEKAWVTLDLPAGEYTVICFLPDFASTPPVSHAEHGMVRTLTVTE